MEMPRVSVIIPARNAAATLLQQLRALAAQTYSDPWEVIVVDNGSTDTTPDVVRASTSFLPQIRVVSASSRSGVSHARNEGVGVARADYVAICDADDEVDPRWLDALMVAVQSHDVVGGRLDVARLNASSATQFRGSLTVDSLPLALGKFPYAVGANFAARKEVIEELGGWREDYRRGSDDADFSIRAQLAGFTVGYAHDAVVHYRFRSSSLGYARQRFWYAVEGAHLYRDYREFGATRRSVVTAISSWAGLLLRLPVVLLRGDQTARTRWLVSLASNWGKLVGSLRYRVLYP